MRTRSAVPALPPSPVKTPTKRSASTPISTPTHKGRVERDLPETPSPSKRPRGPAYPGNNSSISNLATPDRRVASIYSHANLLLSTSNGTGLPLHGRAEERETLTKFLTARFPDLYPSTSTTSLPRSPPPSRPSTPTSPRLNSAQGPQPSLYISGPPGIGKTALLTTVVNDFQSRITASPSSSGHVKVVMENCSSLGSVWMEHTFWNRLAVKLGVVVPMVKGANSAAKARKGFEDALAADPNGRYLLILDEVDHLIPTSRSVSSPGSDLLNVLFSLVHLPDSRLTLIGIANALDLTARSLRLSDGSKPQSLSFRPYSPAALAGIVTERLALLREEYPFTMTETEHGTMPVLEGGAAAGPAPLVEAKALELCSKRVAKATGDVRVILSVVRKAISLVERAELLKATAATASPMPSPTLTPVSTPTASPVTTPTTSSKPPRLVSTSSFSTPTRAAALSFLTPSTAPRVTLKVMLEALRSANLSTPPHLATQLSSLNFDHRAALVGIVVALSKASNSFEVRQDATVVESVAFGEYREGLYKEGTMNPKNANAFRDALDALECAGLIRVTSGPSPKKGGRASPAGRQSGGGAGGTGKTIALGAQNSVAELVEGLRTTPSSACEVEEEQDGDGAGEGSGAGTSRVAGALQETLRISKTILDREEDRLNQIVRDKERRKVQEQNAMEGFHGNGLNDATDYIGAKRPSRK